MISSCRSSKQTFIAYRWLKLHNRGFRLLRAKRDDKNFIDCSCNFPQILSVCRGVLYSSSWSTDIVVGIEIARLKLQKCVNTVLSVSFILRLTTIRREIIFRKKLLDCYNFLQRFYAVARRVEKRGIFVLDEQRNVYQIRCATLLDRKVIFGRYII